MSLVYTIIDNGTSAGAISNQAGTFKLVVSGSLASGAAIGLEMQTNDGGWAVVNRIASASPVNLTSSTAGAEDLILPEGQVRADITGTITGIYAYLIRV